MTAGLTAVFFIPPHLSKCFHTLLVGKWAAWHQCPSAVMVKGGWCGQLVDLVRLLHKCRACQSASFPVLLLTRWLQYVALLCCFNLVVAKPFWRTRCRCSPFNISVGSEMISHLTDNKFMFSELSEVGLSWNWKLPSRKGRVLWVIHYCPHFHVKIFLK